VSDSIFTRVGVRRAYELTTGRSVVQQSHSTIARVRCPSSTHEDTHASCDLDLFENVWKCRTCAAGGGVADVIVAAGKARDRAEAARWLEEKLDGPRAPSNGKSRVVGEYEYRDENGNLLYVVERHEPKRFVQKVPDGTGGWRYKVDGARRVPYRLPELLAAIAGGETIFVIEGEKDADALVALGLCATTSAQGAAWKWPAAWAEFFRGAKRVVVLPDCDGPGRKAAQQRAAVIEKVCNEVRILDLARERSDGYDVSDCLAEGHTRDELLALADAAPGVEAQPRRDVAERDDGIGKLVTVRASEIHAQRVSWFARDRIPFCGLTLFDGPGGIGKTTTLMAIIAGASIGRSFLDGGRIEPITSLVVAEEDGLGRLKMLLRAAGADLDRVHFVKAVEVGEALEPVALPRHVSYLEREIIETGARLVYVDALFSHLELDGDGRMPQQVRRALRPIVEMADRTAIAFTALRHQTKANGSAMQRALGSGELSNVARSVLSFGPHPDDEGLYALAIAKLNWAAKAPTLAYRIEAVIAIDDDGETCEVTRVVLAGEAEGVTADDLAMRLPADPDERGVAEDWLQDYLHDGEPHASAAIYAAARKDGIGSRATLKRAARRLGVLMNREGFATKGGSQSVWTLPLASRSAHSQSVSRADESAMSDTSKTLDSQRSAQGLLLGSNTDDEVGDEPSDGGMIREW
jgi:5S rRNA maturation endonuclease (ribonuclease M5)